MINRFSFRQIAQLSIVVLSTWTTKWFYSTASVDQLRWILWPTTKLVEFVTGARFIFESRAGYMNNQHTFLIAASCAGVNFLITAFVMLAVRKLWVKRNEQIRWRFIPVVAVLAYIATIITNAVRISLAVQTLQSQQFNGWLTAGEVHRLEGILVYFGFLSLLFVVAEQSDRRKAGVDERGVFVSLRRYLYPLSVYYVATLGVPSLNGAFRQREFWEHLRFVLLIPIVLLIALASIHWLAMKLSSLRPGRRLAHPAKLSQALD